MHYRLATIDDLPILIDLRKKLLIEEGQTMAASIDQALENYFRNQLTSNNYVQWLVEQDEQIVATGAIQYIPFPPSYFNPTGLRGYIANMYTIPEARNQGIAKQLVNRLLADAQQRNVRHSFLIASEMGKPLYKKIGFNENDIYMEYILPE